MPDASDQQAHAPGGSRFRARPRLAGWLLLATLAAPAWSAGGAARETLLADIDAIRARGCSGHDGAPTALVPQRALDAAARQLARGRTLRDALALGGYRAETSASIRVFGRAGREDVARFLARHSCAELADARHRDIGIARRGGELWIVLAAPFLPPARGDATGIARRMLQLVNEARSAPRRCGAAHFARAGPLELDPVLSAVALRHARELARRNELAHAGTDGSTPAQRVSAAGYRWRSVAENLASGGTSPERTVRSWLDSPGHCANLMEADYTRMGIAYAVDLASEGGIYWVQLLARPHR